MTHDVLLQVVYAMFVQRSGVGVKRFGCWKMYIFRSTYLVSTSACLVIVFIRLHVLVLR